ncbi:MAG TPA: phosphatase PAP2 family protein [Candidatus Kapabacteria bacterium]|nr:phosphatase PAP2 family protein [Candidatus Kapabacteria bacterium]
MMNPVFIAKRRAVRWDYALCLTLNRWLEQGPLHLFFRIVSRLGDGLLWYGFMLFLPVFLGGHGFLISLLMLAMASLGLYEYRIIKKRSMRPRPFVTHRKIRQGARTLDEFSFPSGHTMHAVAFAALLTQAFPWLGFLLIPFALVTGLSRVVLGLHYPSDVFMGAVLGLFNATLFLALFGSWL